MDKESSMEQDYLPRKYIYGHRDYETSTKNMLEAIESSEYTIFKSDYEKLPADE